MTKITDNFTMEELTASATAKRLKIDNTPTVEVRDSLERLTKTILQPIRDKWGKPIIVTSGYRCSNLNKAVGGAKSSQHMYGEAADFKAANIAENGELYQLIKNMVDSGKIVIGQCIWEYGNSKNPQWIHISLQNAKHKNEFFRIK